MYSNTKSTKKYYISPIITTPIIYVTISDIIAEAFINEANVLLDYYNSNDISLFTNEINTRYTNLLIKYPNYINNIKANTIVDLIDSIYNLFSKSQFIINNEMVNPFIYEAITLLKHYDNNNITLFNNQINTTYSNLIKKYPSYADDIKSNTAVQLINILYNLFTQSQFIVNGDIVDPFIHEAITLLYYFNSNNSTSFHNEIDTTYSKLKLAIKYTNNKVSYTTVQLIDNINSLFITNHDLKNQTNILENELVIKLNLDKIGIDSISLLQNTNLKLVYLQYLLMYDINLSNGLFIDVYLNDAQRVLDSNNGILQHDPTKFFI